MLIISAEEDRLAHVEDGKILANHLPGSTLTIIKGSGHLLNFEQPEIFHASVVHFLESK